MDAATISSCHGAPGRTSMFRSNARKWAVRTVALVLLFAGAGSPKVASAEDRPDIVLMKWFDDQSVERKLIQTSILDEADSEVFSESSIKPRRIASSQSVETAPTDTSNSVEATEISKRLLTAIPASRMTIRRDPSKSRGLPGSDEAPGKTLRELQIELEESESSNEFSLSTPVMAESNWITDEPYGRYLYIHHGPLFFEDIPAERYGEYYHEYSQPFVSFVKFMGTTALLPYKITTDYHAAYHEDGLYAFDHRGNVRPGILEGSFLPSWDVMRQYPRSNFAGVATQAAVVTGAVFIFP